MYINCDIICALCCKREKKVKEIQDKINAILSSSEEEFILEDESFIEVNEDFEVEELYTDIYVLIKNIDDFYGGDASYKAALLMESFLLETMVLLKKNPEVVIVESGDFFAKATAFSPSGEEVFSVFEDAVIINSMLEVYNQSLSENSFPQMEVGIGVATFVKEELEHEHDHDHDIDECDCDHEEGETCSCGHDHHHENEDDEFDYGIDFDNTASMLAELGNNGEFDPIVVNDIAYGLLVSIEEEFFQNHLEEVELEEGYSVFHGNIVREE